VVSFGYFFLEVGDGEGGKQTLNPFFHVIYLIICENVSCHHRLITRREICHNSNAKLSQQGSWSVWHFKEPNKTSYIKISFLSF